MQPFVLYHLPNSGEYFSSESCNVRSSLYLNELKDECGFLVAPFSASKATPYLLFRTNEKQRIPLADIKPKVLPHLEKSDMQSYRSGYNTAFAKIMDALESGQCQKIVLSHSLEVKSNEPFEPTTLFEQACLLYPDRYVALWHAPQSGTWLTATPELLLHGNGNHWKTMALAGTKPSTSTRTWNKKEMDEHQYVVDYLHEQLKAFSSDCHSQSSEDVCAGNVTHLLTNFSFTTHSGVCATDILSALHPTPAVCGTPRDMAKTTILTSENASREYYAGFSGIIDPQDTNNLFVTLRCAKVFERSVRLFGGGGCLSGSDETLEWEETLQKMQTIKGLFN